MRTHLLAVAALLSAGCSAQGTDNIQASAPASATTCRTINRGVEFRTYFPGTHRYVYVSAATIRGMAPSVLVIIDKNYDNAAGPQPAPPDHDTTAWWTDRSRTFSFSTDKITATFETRFTVGSVVDRVFSSSSPPEFTVPIRGLTPVGSHFEGQGSSNTNTYAYEMRVDFPLNTADNFDLILPSVTYDGVTVTPPPLHFVRNDDDPLESDIKCGPG